MAIDLLQQTCHLCLGEQAWVTYVGRMSAVNYQLHSMVIKHECAEIWNMAVWLNHDVCDDVFMIPLFLSRRFSFYQNIFQCNLSSMYFTVLYYIILVRNVWEPGIIIVGQRNSVFYRDSLNFYKWIHLY